MPIIEKNKNVLSDTTWLELTPTGIKGRIKQDLDGYYAMGLYGKLMYWKQSDMNENMKAEFARGSNKFQLDTFSVSKKESNNNITLYANFKLPDYAKKIGNEYYLNLNLFKFFQNEQIDYPKRKMPVEYDFKWVRRYVTMLKIPDGYKLTYLPQSKSYHNNVWGFDMQYSQKDNWVILSQQFDNESLMLDHSQFEQWNKVLENLLPLYKETLSLSLK